MRIRFCSGREYSLVFWFNTLDCEDFTTKFYINYSYFREDCTTNLKQSIPFIEKRVRLTYNNDYAYLKREYVFIKTIGTLHRGGEYS